MHPWVSQLPHGPVGSGAPPYRSEWRQFQLRIGYTRVITLWDWQTMQMIPSENFDLDMLPPEARLALPNISGVLDELPIL